MTLRGGFPLLIRQFKALLYKNLLLSWKNKRATTVQLFSSLFFIFLLFCIDKALTMSRGSAEELSDPKPISAPPIPPCEDKFFTKLPCFDFVWSGNRSAKAQKIVKGIMANNPGRPIPSSKVLSFETPDEVDSWLFHNPMHCPGALHLIDRNATSFSYGLQTNSTVVKFRGQGQDPIFKFQVPLQVAAEREIARYLLGDSKFHWAVSFKEFAHPAVGGSFSTMTLVGPTFFLATAMFGFVIQMSSLTLEKELKLRQAMTMMGLYDTAYWLSWLIWETIMVFFTCLLTVLFGMMFQFSFFLKNSFAVVFLTFFLFQLTMIGFAFMLSAFISKSSEATTVGFSIFIVGFLTQFATASGFPFSVKHGDISQAIWSVFPPNLLGIGLKLLFDATQYPQSPGISWKTRTECANPFAKCAVTMDDIFLRLLLSFFVWFVLAIYFDNIVPNASGVRKSCFYFLHPGYWTGRGGSKVKEGSACFCPIVRIPLLDPIIPDDEDVFEEESIVKKQTYEGPQDPDVAVQIRGLVKTYPGSSRMACCCRCKRTKPLHAAKGLWVNFAKDQLFCLLGPNGAGKTTAISCLTGVAPVTSGDALIYGHSITSAVGMHNTRKIIGVCPQFDILWESLSGTNHLQIFASIKGLPSASIKLIIKKLLAEVKLTEAANRRASSYSGGMKRRLSVAIALIGDPKLLILDEPTTGMDPITRRHVWDVIENAKKGRAIILTTHSMEEADILSDRIGIMARGRLRCIGTSIRLKARFGSGFIATVTFAAHSSPQQHEAVKKFFRSHLNVVAKEESRSYISFVIPNDREKWMTNFFAELENREKEFGIADIQIGLTTLEDVFLNIARKAELEAAEAEGAVSTLVLPSGVSIEVPVGCRFVGIPGSESSSSPKGLMIEVFWEHDDSGSLCISNHSLKIPIPPTVHLPRSLGSSLKNPKGLIYGVPIDPGQVQM